MAQSPTPAVALISGTGSNLQAIITAIQAHKLDITLKKIISNNKNAVGLTLAENAGITSEFVDYRRYPDRTQYDRALIKSIDDCGAVIVILAGFMRILTDEFVKHYHGRLVNIHPSLLPKFKGLNTHQRAIDAKSKQHGASVHFVTPALDDGPIIIQGKVDIHNTDTVEILATKVLHIEHQIYPLALQWLAEGRVAMKENRVFFDGKALKKPLSLTDNIL